MGVFISALINVQKLSDILFVDELYLSARLISLAPLKRGNYIHN